VNTNDDPIRMLVKRSVVEVDTDATLREAAALLTDDSIGAAIVRGIRPMGAPGSRAEGLVSERDIVRALAGGADPDAERVGNVMTIDLATVAAGDTVTSVALRLLDNEIRHLPVVEADVVVGVVSERDLLRVLVDEREPAP
jgi:CBS domain-containing protein